MSAKVSRLLEVNSRLPPRMADWANLQTDVVGTIIGKLAIPDYIRFRAVCTSWNRVCACKDVSNDPRVDPWLMLPTNMVNGAKFFSISERKNETIRILSTATIFGSTWTPVGSSHGWIVFFNPAQGTIQLVNPISSAQYQLPPLGREPFSKAVFLDISESNFTVAVVYGNQKGYKVTRKGSKGWSFVDSKRILMDVFKHRRQLYTIDIYGTVEVWAEPPRAWLDPDIPVVDPYHPSFAQRKFHCLVETPAGDLLKVKRQSQNKFAVWILNRETSSFESTDDIGEFGLFISHHSSFCFLAKDHPNLKVNCVYFIDSYKNLCAFNLENGTKELVEALEAQGLPRQDSFLWFIPSLK